jgi:hypothetical protein
MKRAESVKKKLQEAQLSAMEEIAEAGPEAVGALRHLANKAEDERARYSAASKIVDLLLPRQQAPLVQINMGENLKSHLNLPAAPEALPIDVTAQIHGKSAVEIVKQEVAKRALITPEAAAKARFMRQRFDVSMPRDMPDPQRVPEPKPFKAQALTLKTEVETIPAPAPFPDAR